MGCEINVKVGACEVRADVICFLSFRRLIVVNHCRGSNHYGSQEENDREEEEDRNEKESRS